MAKFDPDLDNVDELIVDDMKEYSDEQLSELLDKQQIAERVNSPEKALEHDKISIEEDFAAARRNIQSILEKGSDTLDEMIKLAKLSDHPRAYEVVSTLINTMVNANNDLMNLHEKKQKISTKIPSQQTQPSQKIEANNVFFVGSSKDVLDMLRAEDDDAIDGESEIIDDGK